MTPIRVVLVDDHPLVLAGVKAVLQATSDIAVIGEASSGGAALALIAETGPDIAGDRYLARRYQRHRDRRTPGTGRLAGACARFVGT